MELAIGLIIIVAIGYVLYQNNRKKIEAADAPYKVEPPKVETVEVTGVNPVTEPTKCGCGRSPTGYCVGLHKLSDEEWKSHNDNPNKVVETATPKVAKKAKKSVKSKSDVRAKATKRSKMTVAK